jgi:CCR4-NOT transcription complex subunit 9
MNLANGGVGAAGGLGGSLGSIGPAAGLGNIPGLGPPITGGSPGPGNMGTAAQDDEKIYALVIDLMDPETRDTALLELSKKREQYDDLALVLWHSFGM